MSRTKRCPTCSQTWPEWQVVEGTTHNTDHAQIDILDTLLELLGWRPEANDIETRAKDLYYTVNLARLSYHYAMEK